MRNPRRLPFLLLLVVPWLGCPLVRAQETVTISKSRLEELERKEADLEKLKRELQHAGDDQKSRQREQTKAEKELRELLEARDAAAARVITAPSATVPPETAHPTPVIADLPALAEGQVVDVVDLMNHYRTAPASAAKRYEAGRIRVAGVIEGFDKPMFVQYGVIRFKAGDGSWRVVCRIEPPANLPALFTAKNGDELMGATSAGVRTVLARVGQRAVIEGWCKGLKDQSVTLTSAQLFQVP